MVRLIALDIDGTLLDSAGGVPQANIDAMARAIEAGIEIVLATGRRYELARPVFERLPGPLTLILSNGAIVKSVAGDTMLRHLLPREVARSVLRALPRHRDMAALLFDRPLAGQVVFERLQWEHPRYRAFYRANREFIAEVAPLEDALTEDPLQVMFTGACREMRDVFERLRRDGAAGDGAGVAARPHHGTGDDGAVAVVAEGGHPGPAAGAAHGAYSVALTEYPHRDFSLVDILQAGCSKGAALREWASGRGIPREAVMAVGDNLNDLEMLEFAGHAVVMGNGLDELKGRGWAVTATNDLAGAAQAIGAILQGRSSVQG